MINNVKVIGELIYVYDENRQLLFTKTGEPISYNLESITILTAGIIYIYGISGDLLSVAD
ncbi:hypothetical protein [Aquella oligotrophica]|uniref:Uncharacterized protein n=1 Tax=Aquella oligotrophica TaxID=2067065 RepID=A0A2I7N2U5_9NEIS|nr:hypothetical protein [Aquella oligotrophica]AUR50769.1 hypothetical protein CUN60_00140 [Aquella oligotrophica]